MSALLLSGCARFPAIDPNGQSIFLPYPASTQLTVPQIHAGNGNPGIIPQDAFPTPLPPPACVDGSCAQPGGVQNLFQHHQKKKQAIANYFAKKDPGNCGQIQLSPTRIVAPVNGEVLLTAGICGKDGYLLKREPLEWMLAPGSVGQFIEVGDDAKGKLCKAFQKGPKVEKLDVDYARGRTSSKATLLTKGTPGCDDDLEIAEGQTWLSISSPNEGVSRVTVLAPDSELWDKRRQTAVIYWVDSQVDFPEPIRIDASQPSVLSTHVTSSEGMQPASGWKVRYTITDPNIAEFLDINGQPVASNIAVVDVDTNGRATVRVRARGPIGVTPVHMEVIRPMQASEGLPELILHQADTFITVSAPGLDLVVNGPQVVAIGDIAEYKITLGNPGDINAENVRLRFAAPIGTTVVEVRPQPDARTDGAYQWDQGVLEAGRAIEFFVYLKVVDKLDAVLQFAGEAVGLSKQLNYPIRAVAPAINVSMVRTPADTSGRAAVGDIVYYEVGVQNTGTQALVNLVVQIDTSAGWQEANSGSNTRSLTIPLLQPGNPEVIPLALRVVQEGPLEAAVTIKGSAGNVLAQSPKVNLTGTPPKQRVPGVDATIRTVPQNQWTIGEPSKAYFIVTNTGETPLENLDVTIRHDNKLDPKQVDTENLTRVRQLPGDVPTLSWTPVRLMPGQFAQLTVLFVPLAAQPAANLIMNVANGPTAANASAQVAVIDPRGVGQPNNPQGNIPGATPSRSGAWQLLFEPLQNPTIVGSRVTIPVEIRNGQNLQDTNLVIKIALPEGMELTSIERGGLRIDATQTERGVWTLPPEKFIRPNETVNFYLIVTPRIVQQATVAIAVSSDGQPTPQVQRRTFTVNPGR